MQDLLGDDPSAIAAFCRGTRLPPNATLLPGLPYSFEGEHPQTPAILDRLNALSVDERRRLARCVEPCGDLIGALADFYHRHLAFFDLQNTAGLVGAGGTAHEAYLTRFQALLRRYQQALLDLHAFERQCGGRGAHRLELQARVRAAYDELNRNFRAELERLVPRERSGRLEQLLPPAAAAAAAAVVIGVIVHAPV